MKTKRGSVLMTSLIAVFLISILAFSVLGMSLQGTQLTGHRTASQMAFDVADAGFQQAFQSLAENASYPGQTNTAFGAGTFTVTVKTDAAYNGCVDVTSVGTVMGGQSIPAVRTIKGRISLSQFTSLLNYAVLAKGAITFSGGANVTSSPAAGEGNVFSDTSVSMTGGTVYGTIGSAGPVTTSGSAGATDGIEQDQPTVPLPTINTATLETEAAVNGTYTGNITVPGGSSKTLKGVINGDVTVSGSGAIVLDGTVYVNGNVTLSGNSYSGSGLLILTGKLVISGNSGLSVPNTTSLAIVDLSSSTSAVTFSGGASVGGFVYVPNGETTVSGGASIGGSLATDTVNFSGSANVTRNTNQSLPTSLDSPSIAYWQDQTGTL